jgi:hypothetical protein
MPNLVPPIMLSCVLFALAGLGGPLGPRGPGGGGSAVITPDPTLGARREAWRARNCTRGRRGGEGLSECILRSFREVR